MHGVTWADSMFEVCTGQEEEEEEEEEKGGGRRRMGG